MTLTMRQIETEAREYIRDLYRKHGITRRVPSARLGEGLSARARANVEEWVDGKCRRRRQGFAHTCDGHNLVTGLGWGI